MPCQSRSREGAWIEIVQIEGITCDFVVAPVRERGLKFLVFQNHNLLIRRSREGAWIEIF